MMLEARSEFRARASSPDIIMHRLRGVVMDYGSPVTLNPFSSVHHRAPNSVTEWNAVLIFSVSIK